MSEWQVDNKNWCMSIIIRVIFTKHILGKLNEEPFTLSIDHFYKVNGASKNVDR